MGAATTLSATELPQPAAERSTPQAPSSSADRRRFTTAVVVGLLAVTIPYLLILWDLWNPGPSALRLVPPGFFYDMQARAMFHGHLYLPNGALGIEAFLHNGHEFTYLGIFPSLLRMPILLVTDHLDGRLTAPSMFLSWVVTGVFSSLMLWRLRILIRGQAVLGRAEAAAYGLFVAVIGAGSVLIYLAATPFVYNEDFAWSVALTVASLFALLGVLERPSWSRLSWTGILILATILNRSPTGYACVIGAGLIAGGSDWGVAVPTTAAGPYRCWGWRRCRSPSAVRSPSKFNLPVGLPMADQVWAP